jgi:hypothetical protein
MNHETSVRTNLAKIYALISSAVLTPGRMEQANAKLDEVVAILGGKIQIPQPTQEIR